MTASYMTLLYVDDTAESAAFYADLFDRLPTVSAPNFVSFTLDGGFTFCLWARHSAKPVPTANGGGEILFVVPDPAAVEAKHADWVAKGISILQAPIELDFGLTFVALDPDGHRLRVCLPDA